MSETSSEASNDDALVEKAEAQSLELLAEVVAEHPGAEERPQQQEMTALVARAAVTGDPLIVQAGTGTGKSLAYLAAAIGTDSQTVVSTATRQLSDQLIASDVPLIAEAAKARLGRKLSARSLKGRANYLCLAKLDDLRRLDREDPGGAGPDTEPMFEDALDLGIDVPEFKPAKKGSKAKVEEERAEEQSALNRPSAADIEALSELLTWAQEPGDGDRAQAPGAPDRVWMQIATNAAGCPGARACQFGEDCFAERARGEARDADLVVVNHALLAQDLISPNPILDGFDLVVVDEVHEIKGYLSSAWGHEIYPAAVERAVLAAVRRIPKKDQAMVAAGSAALNDVSSLISGLGEIPAQRWTEELPSYVDGPLESLDRNLDKLSRKFEQLAKESKSEGEADLANRYQAAKGQLTETVDAIAAMRDINPLMVRWSREGRDGNPASLACAPLEVGRKFRQLIGERSLVATSATAAVGNDFGPVASMMGLTELGLTNPEGDELRQDWTGIDVGSPFDYAKQGILYIPTHVPEPIGKDRFDHAEAVLEELTDLVNAAGGRTLSLSTTSAGAKAAAAHLREHTDFPILEHGELPANILAEEFEDDEESVLCATMGMWNGLNIKGRSCSLVVIDKIPFAPMSDPLIAARREHIDSLGRSGFGEVFVAEAALSLTQGAGRLIRTMSDKGVVAILDQRLLTKGYGKIMLRSLPPMWRTSDKDVAVTALERLVEES